MEYNNNNSHVHAVSASGNNTYGYDADGNQTTRVIGSDIFTLSYNAENRLVTVKKNNLMQMKFTYDGDGKRVKSEQYNSAGAAITDAILFFGNHYEFNDTTNQVTKYYFAGTTRIAMRKYTIPQPMKVEYFVGDHLGSTSLTTDSSGAKVSEIRYKPCPYRVLREGETRYSWTATQTTTPAYQLTRYTFTGQYSYMDDPSTTAVEGFGLMYYGARMYDPALGRFSSPDTIIPESQGTQAWDRYAYVNNNPVRYNDPSGHKGEDGCSAYDCPKENLLNKILSKFQNVDIKNPKDWSIADLKKVYTALMNIMGKNGFTGLMEIWMRSAKCLA